MRRTRIVQVVLLKIALIPGCGDTSPSEAPRWGSPSDEFEMVITKPIRGSDHPIERPIELAVEVTNHGEGGAPTFVSLTIRRGRSLYGSVGLELVEADVSPGTPYVFTGKLSLPGTAPEGPYDLRAEAVSSWFEEPAKDGDPPQSMKKQFRSNDLRITLIQSEMTK